jgi:hypothetical protein
MILSHIVHSIYQKYISLQPVLHERGFRMWAASEAQQLGRGSISVVALATNNTAWFARTRLTNEPPDTSRSRLPGGGRKKN